MCVFLNLYYFILNTSYINNWELEWKPLGSIAASMQSDSPAGFTASTTRKPLKDELNLGDIFAEKTGQLV